MKSRGKACFRSGVLQSWESGMAQSKYGVRFLSVALLQVADEAVEDSTFGWLWAGFCHGWSLAFAIFLVVAKQPGKQASKQASKPG